MRITRKTETVFSSSRSGWRELAAAICLFALAIPAVSTAAILAGPATMTRAHAPALTNPMQVRNGVSDYGFCASVGGVAFGEIARSLDGSAIEGLIYDADKPDGRRLEALVSQGEKQWIVALPVYDWEFIPAARFAAGTQDAAVTFFGELSDKSEEARLREKGCRFVNYHSALDNTLMGLRLMQADLLAFHSIGPFNPAENGVPLKGNGEILGSESENKIANARIQLFWETSEAESYVICDVGREVGFRLSGPEDALQLELSGYPYWASWKAPIDEHQFMMATIVEFSKTLNGEEQAGFLTAMQQTGELPPALEEKFNAYLAVYFETVKERIHDLKEKSFQRLPEVSDALSEIMRTLEGGNPPAYRALQTFMRYAALFRYMKERDPQLYANFVASLKTVVLEPALETPTVICESNTGAESP